MRRREFLAGLAGAAAFPQAAHALTPVILPSPATPPAAGPKPAEPASKLDPILQKAQELGAPVAAIRRAIAISRQPAFTTTFWFPDRTSISSNTWPVPERMSAAVKSCCPRASSGCLTRT